MRKLALLPSLVTPIYAAVIPDVDISSLTYPGQKIQNDWTLGDLLTKTNLLTFIFFLAGLVFFFNLLYAAWDYLLSNGDAKKMAGATQRLLNAFVGVIIVLGSFVIVRLALSILNIQGF